MTPIDHGYDLCSETNEVTVFENWVECKRDQSNLRTSKISLNFVEYTLSEWFRF